MKIYKISSPLPLEAIPVEHGEIAVDQRLNSRVLKQLNKIYNFVDHLGGGMWGIAFLAEDGRVIKITTDKEEVKVAEEIKTLPSYAPFARVYEINPLGDDLWVIVKERVKPLSEQEQGLWNLFDTEFDGSTSFVTEEFKQYMELFEKFENYTIEVSNYLYGDVMSETNIGWDEYGNLKAFDARRDVRGSEF